jgi:YD repeat-containing protein
MTVSTDVTSPDAAVFNPSPTSPPLGGPFGSGFTMDSPTQTYVLSTYTVSSPVTFTVTGTPGGASGTLTVTPFQLTLSGGPNTIIGGGVSSWTGTLTFNAPVAFFPNLLTSSCDSNDVNTRVGGQVDSTDVRNPVFYAEIGAIASPNVDVTIHCYFYFIAADGGKVSSNTISFLIKGAPNKSSPPSAASETTLGPQCVRCGQPINLTTGNTYIHQIDVTIPGLGGGLVLSRFWNSLWPSTQNAYQIGLFGPNWRSTYEERVFWGSDGTLKYSRADGSFWSFNLTNSSSQTLSVVAPKNEVATMTGGSTYWTLAQKSGEQRLFDNASGMLTAIIDRNGNTTQLSYDGLNRLVTVTDPAGRHLSFAYQGPSPNLVSGLTSDVGLALVYSYDAQGRLLQVTKPDHSTLNFEYDPNSFITAVKDAQGKILEAHTYDSQGRGLSSSRANGVESVSVSYPQ